MDRGGARIVVATANAGKLREVQALLGARYALLGLATFPDVTLPEEGDEPRERDPEGPRRRRSDRSAGPR